MPPASRFGATKFRNAVPSTPARSEWYRASLPSSASSTTSATSTFSSGIKTSRTSVYTLTPGGEMSVRPYIDHEGSEGAGEGAVWAGKFSEVGDWDVSKVETADGELVVLGSSTQITVLSSSFETPAPIIVETITTPGPISNLNLHPNTSGLVFASSPAQSAVYDLSHSSSPSIILSAETGPAPSRGLWSAAWSPDGRVLATFSRSAQCSIYDVRAASSPVQSRSLSTSIQSLKPARIALVSSTTSGSADIFLTSFSKSRNREYSLLSASNSLATVFTNSVDTNPAPLIPVVDDERWIVYATARGDMTLRQIELSGPQGFQEMVHPLPFAVSSGSIALAHPCSLPVMKAQIAEVLLPVVDKDGDAVLPLGINVPRRHLIDFHQDLYPDVPSPVTAQTAVEWLKGENKVPALLSLDPARKSTWDEELKKLPSRPQPSSTVQKEPTPVQAPSASPAVNSPPVSTPAPIVSGPAATAPALAVTTPSASTSQPAPSTTTLQAPESASTEYKMSLISPFIIEQLEAYRKTGATAPLMIGLQGPQGCGKTTLCNGLLADMKARGKRVAVLSLDDLYRTNAGLKELAAKHPNNGLLSGRGPPGTHDVDLAVSVLDAVSRLNEPDAAPVALPIFDKSLCGGEGDRSTETISIEGPLDVFVLEGWSFGFSPLSPSDLQGRYASPPPPTPSAPHIYFTRHSLDALTELNDYLATFAQAVYGRFRAIVQVQPETYEHVFKWRLEQEHAMKKANGGKGMNDDQVKAFVERYMPGYELWAEGVGKKDAPWSGKVLRLFYGAHREVVKVEKGDEGGARVEKGAGAQPPAAVSAAPKSTQLTQPTPTAAPVQESPAPASAPAVSVPAAVPAPQGPRFNPTWSRKYLAGKSPLIPTYDQVPPISTLHQDSVIFKTTRKYAFFPISGTGGRLGVHPLARKGRMPTGGVGYLSAGVEMVDFDVEKWKEGGRVAVAGEDGLVRVWKVVNDIEGAGPEPDVVLKGDKVDKITQVTFHPTVKDLLVIASNDAGKAALRFFDLSEGQNRETKVVELDLPGVFNFAFSPDGSRVAIATKNSQLVVLDPRDPSTLITGPAHDSPRSFQLTWIDDLHLLSIGFARGSQRKINLYRIDSSSKSISTISSLTIDVSPSVLFPVFDADTSILFVWGKGERVINAFEVHPTDRTEPIARLPSFVPASGTPQLGVAFSPKATVDVKKVEVAKALRLSAKSIEEVSFTIPRNKPEFFQDDIYPPTANVEVPAMEVASWLKAENAMVQVVNLRPDGMALLSTAPKPTVVKPKFVPAQDVMSEQEKKKQEMDALFARAKAGDSSDEDDEPPRSGLAPPDDDW